MAHAPQIPNLLTSRANGPGRVRRGGFRGVGSGAEDGGEDPAAARARKDKVVQGTDTDANVSRMSAVSVGYLDDPFAKDFATSNTQRRFPIINRGTFPSKMLMLHPFHLQMPPPDPNPLMVWTWLTIAPCKTRDLPPHPRPRPPRRRIPLLLPLHPAPSHLPRRRLRHPLLPPLIPARSPQRPLPRARLPHQHRRQNRHHQQLPRPPQTRRQLFIQFGDRYGAPCPELPYPRRGSADAG